MTGYTDMRKSIDGLCAIVEDQLHMDPRRSALYLFCGKRCDRVKALLWENDGFVLLYKRMEVKGRFRWPRSSQEVRQLTWQQFDWLMSGLEIEHIWNSSRRMSGLIRPLPRRMPPAGETDGCSSNRISSASPDSAFMPE